MDVNASIAPEIVAEFTDAWPSGIAVSRSGRVFVSFPRVEEPPAPITLAEIIDGKAIPFPDELVNAIDPTDTAHRFVSVHGIALGPGNRLLVLDTAANSFDGCDPKAAKLWIIDLDSNTIVHGITFPDDVVLPTTYLNDLVIDSTRGKNGFAYITDSGSKGPNGIIVVDLDSGRSWRRLSGHASVRGTPRDGFAIAAEGELVMMRDAAGNTQPVTVGCDGIALSPDAKRLWWTPLSTYGLYSVDVDALVDPQTTDDRIARTVTAHDEREFACDGLDCDREGRVYFTDATNSAVQRFLPAENRYERLFSDPRMIWPDAIELAPDRTIYITSSQIHRGPQYNRGVDRRERPYRLFRAAIDADPGQF